LIDRLINYDPFPTGAPDGEIGLPDNIQLQRLVLFWNYSRAGRLDAFVPAQVNTERLRQIPGTCPILFINAGQSMSIASQQGGGTGAMRQNIIELLEFPRQWIPDHIELEMCPYSGLYNQTDHHCERCTYKSECHWLFNNGEFLELCKRPSPTLLASLELALWLIDAHRCYDTHTRHCSCDLCTWCQQTEKLLTAH